MIAAILFTSAFFIFVINWMIWDAFYPFSFNMGQSVLNRMNLLHRILLGVSVGFVGTGLWILWNRA